MEYFCCYHSYSKKCEKLTDQELGRLFRALMAYSATGQPQELAGRESIAFDFIADDIDRAKKNYEEKCAKNRANASVRKQTVTNGSDEEQTPPKNKNKDKSKEENKGIMGKSDACGTGRAKPFPQNHPAYQAAVYLNRQICSRYPSQQPANEKRLQSWADAFDKCHRLDGQSWEDIGRVLRFSQKDPFWQTNILSAKKFREKYLQLLAKMQQGPSADRGPPRANFPDYGDKEEYL